MAIIEISENPLSMVLVPRNEWDELKTRTERIEQILTAEASPSESEWIESATARKMLGVSQKTWQIYRDNRTIPFCQFGRKILVRKSDVEAFLEKHYVSTTSNNV